MKFINVIFQPRTPIMAPLFPDIKVKVKPAIINKCQ